MPYANPEKQSQYQLKWREQKRQKFMEGKSCHFCGSTENLVIHHINKEEKTSHKIWFWEDAKIKKELKKCVWLCDSCHRKLHGLEKRQMNAMRGMGMQTPVWY